MNWINAFEIICYVITLLLLVDIVRKKKQSEIFLFISAALAGFILELLAVRLTGIYHYSNAYYISIGAESYQFPFFGGLMWGGLTVCALRIARKFQLNDFWSALISGWLIVSLDLLLDVAAIRLNGGFWSWDGRTISLAVNHHMFMSVIWVNFLGYLFETPALVYLTLSYHKKGDRSLLKNTLAAFAISLSGVVFVGIASTLSLWLDQITDEWFSCLAFILIWCIILLKLISQMIRKWRGIFFKGKKDWTLFIFWTSLYGYCLIALQQLGIIQAVPLYGILGVFLMGLTMLLSLMQIKKIA